MLPAQSFRPERSDDLSPPPSPAVIPLIVLADATADGVAKSFANALDGDPVEHLLEESSDNHSRRFFSRQTTALGVENHFVIHAARRGAVRAADIVGLNFEAGNGIGPRVIGQHQIVVALVAVGLLRRDRL